MKKYKENLSEDEYVILNAFEAGELKSVSDIADEKNRIKNIAKMHGLKNRRVSLRMSEWDFTKIQEEALKEGLPYQTLLSSIIHKYLTGQFNDREKR